MQMGCTTKLAAMRVVCKVCVAGSADAKQAHSNPDICTNAWTPVLLAQVAWSIDKPNTEHSITVNHP